MPAELNALVAGHVALQQLAPGNSVVNMPAPTLKGA
jgi:hypothetical protein